MEEPTTQERLAESRQLIRSALDEAYSLYIRQEVTKADQWREQTVEDLWQECLADIDNYATKSLDAVQCQLKVCRNSLIVLAKVAAKLKAVLAATGPINKPTSMLKTGGWPELDTLARYYGITPDELKQGSFCEFCDPKTHECSENEHRICQEPKASFCKIRFAAIHKEALRRVGKH